MAGAGGGVGVGQQTSGSRQAPERTVRVGQQENGVGAELDRSWDGSRPVGDVPVRTQGPDGFTELGSYKAAWVHSDKLQQNVLFLCSFLLTANERCSLLVDRPAQPSRR